MVAISITALNDPIAIVHIPIELADRYSTQVYWTVDNASGLSSEFFNVTSNSIEIAIFAQTDLINTYWTDLAGTIKVSSTWRVFEISSGDQGETNNYDSPHLRHVSAPLSRAGISILYQSSYFTDFLLVKESNFQRASEIFAAHGWQVDPNIPSPRRRSQLLSPVTPLSRSSPSPVNPPPTAQLTVLPSPLACVGFSHSIEGKTAERVRQLVVWPEQATKSWRRKRSSLSNSTPVDTQGRPFLSYTRTEDGASIVTETRILRWMFGRKQREVDQGESDGYESVVEGTEFQLGGQLAVGYVTDTTDLDTSDDECDDLPTTPNFGGYHTPPTEGDRRAKHFSLPATPCESPGIATTIPISWTKSSASRRSTISLRSAGATKRRSWDRKSTSRDRQEEDEVSAKQNKPGRKRCLQLDLRGLADEDDEETLTQVTARATPLQEHGLAEGIELPDFILGDRHTSSPVYHMDKSGLVTMFSELLDSGSIRMLYSSTFHTANILVEARDVHRAKRLLQGKDSASPMCSYF